MSPDSSHRAGWPKGLTEPDNQPRKTSWVVVPVEPGTTTHAEVSAGDEAVQGAEVKCAAQFVVRALGQRLGGRALGEGIGRLGDGGSEAHPAHPRRLELGDGRR